MNLRVIIFFIVIAAVHAFVKRDTENKIAVRTLRSNGDATLSTLQTQMHHLVNQMKDSYNKVMGALSKQLVKLTDNDEDNRPPNS